MNNNQTIPGSKNDAALRKRSQIAKTNRTMLFWIAIASALVGAAAVVSIFLVQKLTYNERVLGTLQTTDSTLKQNLESVKSLQESIRVLDTNSALASVKANPEDQSLQVILDALPSDANSFALGASLQNKLLNGIDGLTIDSLQVDPVVGVETYTGDSTTVDAGAGAAASEITFQFSVKGTEQAMRKVLTNLEASIRTIKISSMHAEIKGQDIVLSVKGSAFYEPAKTIELQEKVQK